MESEVSRGADADGPPPPQPGPPTSSPPRSSLPVTGSKAKILKDRVSFSSSRPRPSCWGRIRMIHHRVGRSRSRAGTGAAPDATMTISSRGVCGGGGDRGRCGCGPSGGRADATAGARSLLQRNDFYCDECNTHR